MSEKKLTYISIDKLLPHPDNPRKDVGDVSELAESIKESGILQNLTVVPYEGNYRVIIGHRRLAAAKLAGLTEVPCYIADMDYKTQVSTMIAENMQRVDLTVPEQVEGIQMMLDLGESIETVKKKTGLSDTTVRHRLKMAELPKEAFKKSYEQGGTIEDYIKIEKIKDPKLKEKVLETVGTNNFEYSLRTALEDEKYLNKLAEVRQLLDNYATEIKKERDPEEKELSVYLYTNTYMSELVEYFQKHIKDKLFYFIGQNSYDRNRISIFRELSDTEIAKLDKKKAVEERKKQKLKDRITSIKNLGKQFAAMREEFVVKYNSNEYFNEIVKFIIKDNISFNSYNTVETVKKLLKIENDSLMESDEFNAAYEKCPSRILLLFLFADTKTNMTFFGDGSYYRWYADKLKRFVELLETLGYPVSDEERAYLDGTHELYV